MALEVPDALTLLVWFGWFVAVPGGLIAGAMALAKRPLSWRRVAGGGVVALPLFALGAAEYREAGVEMSQGLLTVHAGHYSVHRLIRDVNIAGIAPVPCGSESRYASSEHRDGTALPGYQAGWFSNRAGDALFIVRRSDECVLIPAPGVSLLLGSTDAAGDARRVARRLSQAVAAQTSGRPAEAPR